MRKIEYNLYPNKVNSIGGEFKRNRKFGHLFVAPFCNGLITVMGLWIDWQCSLGGPMFWLAFEAVPGNSRLCETA